MGFPILHELLQDWGVLAFGTQRYTLVIAVEGQIDASMALLRPAIASIRRDS